MRRLRHLKPREIQGCDLAFDASVESSVLDENFEAVPNGVEVAFWVSQSSGDWHAENITKENLPQYMRNVQGGMHSLRFISSNLEHYHDSPSLENTIVCALKSLSAQSGLRGIFSHGGIESSLGASLFRSGSSIGFSGHYSSYSIGSDPFVITQSEFSDSVSWRVNLKSEGSVSQLATIDDTNHIGGRYGTNQNIHADLYFVGSWAFAMQEYVSNRIQASIMRKWRMSS